MRKCLFLLLAVVAVSGCSETERTESVTAEITAAQMEGRRAARDVVLTDVADTAGLQRKLLEAKSRQSRYELEDKRDCAAAFDSAFVSTVRAVRPDIARGLQGD